LALKINGNRCAQQEISVLTKVSKEIVPFQTGIPNLGVWCKKWSNWTSGVGVGQTNPTPTPSVARNPTPPKNLRLLTTPTPQPCLQQTPVRIVYCRYMNSPISVRQQFIS